MKKSDYWILTEKGAFIRSLSDAEAKEMKANGTPIEKVEMTHNVIASLFNQVHFGAML